MAGQYDQFLLFGDSIIQQACSQENGFGFVPALQDAYIRLLDVVNRGFSGYNTTQALKILPQFMPTPAQAKIRFMMISFGANDACLPNTTGQHVPLELYKQNLRDIAMHPSITAHQPRLILVTPPPIDEALHEASGLAKGFREPRRTAEHTKLYANACREVGAELQIAVLDLWSIFAELAGWRGGLPLVGSKTVASNDLLVALLRDGLHFTPKGYHLLYEVVLDLIRQTWPDQHPASLPFVFPDWQSFL